MRSRSKETTVKDHEKVADKDHEKVVYDEVENEEDVREKSSDTSYAYIKMERKDIITTLYGGEFHSLEDHKNVYEMKYF